MEQYKEKMRSGNRGLVAELLKRATLPHLEVAVEAQFKKSALRCLRKMDAEDALGDFFYPQIRELQRVAGEERTGFPGHPGRGPADAQRRAPAKDPPQ
jgi:hypothetical protein